MPRGPGSVPGPRFVWNEVTLFMDTIEIARRLAELGQTEEAQAAYSLVLQEAAERNPELELEAASYLFSPRETIRWPIRRLFPFITGGFTKQSSWI